MYASLFQTKIPLAMILLLQLVRPFSLPHIFGRYCESCMLQLFSKSTPFLQLTSPVLPFILLVVYHLLLPVQQMVTRALSILRVHTATKLRRECISLLRPSVWWCQFLLLELGLARILINELSTGVPAMWNHHSRMEPRRPSVELVIYVCIIIAFIFMLNHSLWI